MLIFEGDEFPLVESGDVRLYPLPRNASLYFSLRATSQLPAHELRYYSEERASAITYQTYNFSLRGLQIIM